MYLNLVAAILEATIISRKNMSTEFMTFTTPHGKPEMKKLMCDLKAMAHQNYTLSPTVIEILNELKKLKLPLQVN